MELVAQAEVSAHQLTPLLCFVQFGAGGWDDDDLAVVDEDEEFGGGAFPSIRDFTAKKERQADVLDMILAMLLQRQPPRQQLESEGDHFTELAELHNEVRTYVRHVVVRVDSEGLSRRECHGDRVCVCMCSLADQLLLCRRVVVAAGAREMATRAW